jgi:dolichol-phosphate mannosyltransferase
MYKGKRVMVILPALNEAGKVGKVLDKMPRDVVDQVVVVDDGSTDGTAAEAEARGAFVIRHPVNRGVGAAIRTGIEHALAHGFDITVVMASDDQDVPAEVTRLLDPIIAEGMDYVHGSRYLKGGAQVRHPLYRTITTRLYSLLFRLLTGAPITDGTNGFRAFRTAICDRFNLWQDWLDRYELEPYLYYQVVKQGYKWKEVPVTKVYPQDRKIGYTKMKPFRDWWRISRPLFFLALGLKK